MRGRMRVPRERAPAVHAAPRPQAARAPLRRPLPVAANGGAHEHEAHRAADAVSGGAAAGVQRCACGEELMRDASGDGPALAPPVVHDVIASPGAPLEAGTRARMERRMGADFGAVRVHTDARAADSARAVGAHAYTVGSDVAFGAGRYAPGTAEGDRLIAHELAHVVQQGGRAPVVQRQSLHSMPPDPAGDPRMHATGAPGAVSCAPPAGCPPHFCQPYSSASFALHQRTRMTPFLMLGIRAAVDGRVVPLWAEYLNGGGPPRDLSGTFAADFTASVNTAAATRHLVSAMEGSVRASPPPLGTFPMVRVDFAPRLAAELAALNTPGGAHELNFNQPGEIPGNLAGGIGTNQTGCRSGAAPSPVNDARRAEVSGLVSRDPSGGLRVLPFVRFTVQDTIDLCPGNCGTSFEQMATVAMSQFEATGISGDVPFTISFAAPLALTQPFTVPAPSGTAP